MRKSSVLVVLAAGASMVALFLNTRSSSLETRKPEAGVEHQATAPSDKVRSSSARDRKQGKTQTQVQPQPLPENAVTLLSLLKTAIAEGDWQKAKKICEKLPALPEAFDLLVEILLDNGSMEENDIGLRWRAAYILGLLDDKRAIAVFEQALASEKAIDVRSNIVLALGMFNDPQARLLLESVFLNDTEDSGIRQSAAQYLARIPGGAGILSDILNSESTREEKQFAVEGMAFSVDKQLAAAALADLLNNREQDMLLRRAAAKALGILRELDSLSVLTASLQEDPDFRVRNACAQALGVFRGNNEVLAVLRASLHNDKDPTVRGCAAQALGELGSKQAVSDLKEALKRDRNRVVRVRIVEALGKIGGAESKKILTDAAKKDPSVHVRNAAQKALQQFNQ